MTYDVQEWLSRAAVADAIFEFRPDYCAALMVMSGVPSGPCDEDSEALLRKAERSVGIPSPDRESQIDAWKQTYVAFGAKPNRTRVSVDALTRRAASGGLPRINRITDIYNAVSVLHGVPIGAEDVAAYRGPLRLVRAIGDETFATTRDGIFHSEHADPGEPVWRDDLGVTCRRWNWRQTPRTALTETTSTAVFIVDALGTAAGRLAEAVLHDLGEAIGPGVASATRVITRDH